MPFFLYFVYIKLYKDLLNNNHFEESTSNKTKNDKQAYFSLIKT